MDHSPKTIPVEHIEPEPEPVQSEEVDILHELEILQAPKEAVIDEPESELPNDGTVIIHCLPAFVKDKTNSLRGSEVAAFGEKFVFEGKILDYNDLEIEILTRDARVTRGSIIFPKRYKNGEALEHFRWWKVTRLSLDNEEFIVTGMISTLQPSFS